MKPVVVVCTYVAVVLIVNSILIMHMMSKSHRAPHVMRDIRLGDKLVYQVNNDYKGCILDVHEIADFFDSRDGYYYITINRLCGYLTCNGSPANGVGDKMFCDEAENFFNPKYVPDHPTTCIRDASGKDIQCQ